MNTSPIDLNIEVRLADGTTSEFYQTDEERIREALRLLSAPRLFAQPHLLVTSRNTASIIPCKGIDMILVRTTGPTPLKFPLSLPVGLFDIVEQSEDSFANDSLPTQAEPRQSNQHTTCVEVRTLGGWSIRLKAAAVIRANVQDERQFFSHLPELPTIPFRVREGGFGVINTANITRASASPKPAALPGIALPLIGRQPTPSRREPILIE